MSLSRFFLAFRSTELISALSLTASSETDRPPFTSGGRRFSTTTSFPASSTPASSSSPTGTLLQLLAEAARRELTSSPPPLFHSIPLEDVPKCYTQMDKHENGIVKTFVETKFSSPPSAGAPASTRL